MLHLLNFVNIDFSFGLSYAIKFENSYQVSEVGYFWQILVDNEFEGYSSKHQCE